MIIVFPHLIAKSFSAVTVFPFIFLKNKQAGDDFVLINHEKIHIRQQIELLWIVLRLVFARNIWLKAFGANGIHISAY